MGKCLHHFCLSADGITESLHVYIKGERHLSTFGLTELSCNKITSDFPTLESLNALSVIYAAAFYIKTVTKDIW